MTESVARRVQGRYELSELIAVGGMGEVWRGRDAVLGRPVAVKLLRSDLLGDPSFADRFRAEAHHAASLSHPNIAAVYDYGEKDTDSGTGRTGPYLVMELVDGEPLSAVLQREGSLDVAATLSVWRQSAAALAEAHGRGVVHRDVKPANILVQPDGRVKITDFGIARSIHSASITGTGQLIGTPQYLSPEQLESHPATPASDVYALGLVAHECLTGQAVFDGETPLSIALQQLRQEPAPLPAAVPAEVRELIARSLVKDPARRIADAAALGAAIDALTGGRGTAGHRMAAPVAATGRTTPPRPRAGRDTAPLAVALPVATATATARAAGGRDGRRRSIAVLAGLLLALLAGGALAAALLWNVLPDRPASSVDAAERPSAAVEVLDPGDHLGQPVDEVAAELEDRGLTVERRPRVDADAAPGTVLAIDPEDVALDSGDRVVVTFAIAPTGGDGGGGADGAAPPGGGDAQAPVEEQQAPAGGADAPAGTAEQPAGSPGAPAGGGGAAPAPEPGPERTAEGEAPAPQEEALPQEALPQEALPQEALPQEALPQEALPPAPQEAPASEAPASEAPPSGPEPSGSSDSDDGDRSGTSGSGSHSSDDSNPPRGDDGSG